MKIIIGIVFIFLIESCAKKSSDLKSIIDGLEVIQFSTYETEYFHKLKNEDNRVKGYEYFLIYQDSFFLDSMKMKKYSYSSSYPIGKWVSTKEYLVGKLNLCNSGYQLIVLHDIPGIHAPGSRLILNRFNQDYKFIDQIIIAQSVSGGFIDQFSNTDIKSVKDGSDIIIRSKSLHSNHSTNTNHLKFKSIKRNLCQQSDSSESLEEFDFQLSGNKSGRDSLSVLIEKHY